MGKFKPANSGCRNSARKRWQTAVETALGTLLAFATPAVADQGPLASSLLEEDSKFDIRGWVSQGFTFNTTSSSSFNGPVSFNDRAEEYQMNQFYLVAEKATEQSGEEWDLGGRVDVLYGTDAQFTQSIGFDDNVTSDNYRYYKLAIPQVYVEANLPILNGVTVKAGHFYTLIGYEVVTAPDNFFYSHAYTMQYGEPFTHWGALASTSLCDGSVTLTAGGVRGWDNLSDTADGNLAFLGGVSYTPWESTSITASVISGNEGASLNRTMYSLVLSQQIGEDFSYVLQHDHGIQEVAGGQDASWYGINQYLIYNLSDTLSPGLRVEWFRDHDGTRVAGVRSGYGGKGNYYGFSAGLNIHAHDLVTFRPEIRYDVFDGPSGAPGAYGRGDDDHQLLVAMDAIVKF